MQKFASEKVSEHPKSAQIKEEKIWKQNFGFKKRNKENRITWNVFECARLSVSACLIERNTRNKVNEKRNLN